MKKIFLFTSFLISNIAFAHSEYSIIVAADDNASSLHIFKIEKFQTPKITEFFSESISSTLASYADNPSHAGSSLKLLLDDANSKINQARINPKDVKINVLGTQNMRSLSNEKQKLIYDYVKEYIKNNYEFSLENTQSITEKNQSLAYWLAANYLAENFQNNNQTQGSLNIGNNSSQIAFETQDTSQPDYETKLNINGKNITVFSKQLSNIGQENILNEINSLDTAFYCYPINYNLERNKFGNFNLNNCKLSYSSIFKKYKIPSQLLAHQNQPFVITGTAQRVYEDFLSAADPDIYSFEARLSYACSSSWDLMQLEYDNFPKTELSKICAHSVFLDRLIYDELGLMGKDIFVSNKINNHEIDWPLGMTLLAYLTTNPSS